MEKVSVQNMKGRSGREVPNQFEIFTPEGKYFQSYSSVIAFRDHSGNITLDAGKWDYSRTTVKYLGEFLREKRAEIEKKIKAGIYKLANLN